MCSVCDALIDPGATRSLSARTWWVIIAVSVVAAVVLAGTLAVVSRHAEPENSSAPTAAASTEIRQWWLTAHGHFNDLQDAVDDSRAALQRRDEAVLEESCQRLHDAGAVELRAHLPAPDPDLTAEIEAAITDAHEASHMCLAAASGSLNNYAGEFMSNLDQADKHLAAALDIVNKSLLEA